MTIVLSAFATGPDPSVHEIVHVGAQFCSDDFREVWNSFYTYIRCERPEMSHADYLDRAGFASVDALRDRGSYHRERADVWQSFARTVTRLDAEHTAAHKASPSDRARWADAGQGAGGVPFEDVLARTRFACFSGVGETPFLLASFARSGFVVDLDAVRHASSLSGLLADYAVGLSYLGIERQMPVTFEESLDFLAVKCANPSDPLERADAVRRAYVSHFTQLRKIYESAAKWQGSQKRRRR